MLEKLLDWSSKMVKWTPGSLKKWADTRRRGRSHYVLWWGVYFSGGLTAIFMIMFWAFFQARSFEDFVELGLLMLIICPIGGYFFGRVTWAIMERSYEAYVKQHPES